jgi:hypothetical protein
MALPFPTMADAVSGAVASSNEYNKLIDNIIWLGGGVDANTATITNTSGTVGIGNQRLSDRLGSGVTNTSDVTTGTATAQLTNVRSRLTTLESGGGPVAGSWVECPKISPWGNRTGFGKLSVRTLPNDNVQIFGTIMRSSGTGSPGEDLANLPSNTYWPPATTVVFAVDSGGKATFVAIEPDGLIQLYIPTATTTTNTITINAIYYKGTGIVVA